MNILDIISNKRDKKELTKEEIEATKQDVIDFADIGEHLYQPVKTYSSGMFARLAFACAINVDPDILIVDEVLSVGDMAFQLKGNRKETENKTIRFPIHLIDQIEQAISDSDQDITFSSFVIQACEYALDHMDAPSEEHN